MDIFHRPSTLEPNHPRLPQTRLFILFVKPSAAAPHKLQNRPDQQADEKNSSANQPSAVGTAAAWLGFPTAERHTEKTAMHPTAAAEGKIPA